MRTNTAENLTIDLVPFRDSVQATVRRHKMLMDLMRREGYSQENINKQEDILTAELRDLRIRTAAALQDTLTIIIRDNR